MKTIILSLLLALVSLPLFAADNVSSDVLHPNAAQNTNAVLTAKDNGDGTYTLVVDIRTLTVSGTSVVISGSTVSITGTANVNVTGTAPVAVTGTANVNVTGTANVTGAVTVLSGTVSTIPLTGNTAGLVRINSAAYESSHVLKNSPGTLLFLKGYNSGPAQFIQLYDSATVPADTAAPVLTMAVSGSSNFVIEIPSGGIPFLTGIAVSNSTTGPTKTSGTTNTFYTSVIK